MTDFSREIGWPLHPIPVSLARRFGNKARSPRRRLLKPLRGKALGRYDAPRLTVMGVWGRNAPKT